MSNNKSFELDGLVLEKINDFVVVATPAKQSLSVDDLTCIVEKNRNLIMEIVSTTGALLFRGFKNLNTDVFNTLALDSFDFEPNNAFNVGRMPAFIATALRKYSESLVGGDYRRYINKDTVRLGPADNSIQGPHVEGGVSSNRCRFLVLGCEQPSDYLGETALCDFSKVWEELPAEVKELLQGGKNYFRYTTRRKINLLDWLILKFSPYKVVKLDSGKANLVLPPCPVTVSHPETKEVCIQPWSFALNTNDSVFRMAKEVFKSRPPEFKDHTADSLNLNWAIYDKNDEPVKWDSSIHDVLFRTIFENTYLLSWRKDDIAVVDNVRCGHWRMNGEQGDRKIVQIQADCFDANEHALRA